jgi:3-mercaptopyruvate sulfurtransferase SseA
VRYADLDKALSDSKTALAHQAEAILPPQRCFQAWLSSIGLANDMQQVVHDRNSNHCVAACDQVGGHANVVVPGWWATGHKARRGQQTQKSPHIFRTNFVWRPNC